MSENTGVDISLVLAIETSGDVCSVASLRSGLLVSEHIFRHGMHLSERLLEHVDAVLSDADAQPEDVDLFAVGLGPGSFTGTRIGVMTIKTFALLLRRPVYGIDSLAAMAQAYAGVRDTLIVPMHPCRSGIVYTGLYDASKDVPETIHEPCALSILDLANIASATAYHTLCFVGTASVKYRAELLSSLGSNASRAVFGEVMYPRASDVGSFAMAKVRVGFQADNALNLVPQYVSPPPITMPKSPIA